MTTGAHTWPLINSGDVFQLLQRILSRPDPIIPELTHLIKLYDKYSYFLKKLQSHNLF